MRSNWRYRLAALVAAAAAALTIGAGPMAIGMAAHAVADGGPPPTCPPGTHWDNTLNECV
jgi:hypothetical protein